MILMKDNLRVALVTGHIPLAQVASKITVEDIVSKLRIFNQSLRQDFGIVRPRIAVLSLNPHAGDAGLLGKEEEDIIIKHMWGATLAPPRYKESFVVTMVDKYWAVKEASEPWRKKMAKRRFFHRKMLKS